MLCSKCGCKLGSLSNYGTSKEPLCFDCNSANIAPKEIVITKKSNPNQIAVPILIIVPIILTLAFRNIHYLEPIVVVAICGWVILKRPFSAKGE